MDTISDIKINIPTAEDVDKMLSNWGIDAKKIFQCPTCEVHGIMRLMIPHLNDSGYLQTPKGTMTNNHKWSFKQIGKWLEGLGY